MSCSVHPTKDDSKAIDLLSKLDSIDKSTVGEMPTDIETLQKDIATKNQEIQNLYMLMDTLTEKMNDLSAESLSYYDKYGESLE